MAALLVVVLYGIIQISVSQFTKSTLCLSGADYFSYEGTYYYYTTKYSHGKGGVWRKYTSNGYLYLYPWDYDNGGQVLWAVGYSYYNDTAHLACVGASTYNTYYAILDAPCSSWMEYSSINGWYTVSITINSGLCDSTTAYPTPRPTYYWEYTPSPSYSSGSITTSSSTSSVAVIGGIIAAVIIILLIGVLIFACNRRKKLKSGDQYKAGLLANAGGGIGPSPTAYPGPAKSKVIAANPTQQATQMGFVTVSQQPMPQQRVVTNAQGQRVVYATQPLPNQGTQPIIMRPQPQTQGAQVVVGMTPQQRQPVTIQGQPQQQPKIVYVQAPQQLGPNGQPLRGPAPVYVQPVQSGQPPVQVQNQPAPVIMGSMESEKKEPPPVFIDPNGLQQPSPQYQKQSSEGNAGGTSAQIMNRVEVDDEAPPPYMDINPSAPALSLSVAEAQDLESFLRQNELDAHDASLREAGAESLDDLKDLNGDEIKQVAIDAGMDETDQRMFINACMKLKQ